MRMSRTIALGLVWLATATPICLSSLFLGSRYLIREIQWESDGGDRLQTLTLPFSSLDWYEEDRELLIGGRMFDVKSIAVKDGMARVTGFFDDLETELNRALDDTGGTGKPVATSGWRLFQSCLGILGISTDSFHLQERPPGQETKSVPTESSIALSSGHRRIPIPPPQIPS
jgi:hypothetical protein